jgi:hypothetical protein
MTVLYRGTKLTSGAKFNAPRSSVISYALPSDYSNLLAWHDAGNDGYDGYFTLDNGLINTNLSTWTPTRLTSVTGGKTDPFGGTGAWELVEDATAASTKNLLSIWTSRTVSDIEFDIYVKRATGSRNVCIAISTSNYVLVNLSDGSFILVGSLLPLTFIDVTKESNGWYRIRGIITNSTTPNLYIYLNASTTSLAGYDGDGVSGIYVYSDYYGRQRRVSNFYPRAGSVTAPITQTTQGNRPTLYTDKTLGWKRVVMSYNTLNTTKALNDPSGISSALSGTDQPFTAIWLARNTANTTNDCYKLVGSTALHKVLSTDGYAVYSMSRKDDAATTVTPTFDGYDFTSDNNWHVVSIVFDGTQTELYIDGRKSNTTFSMNVGACTFTSSVEGMISRAWRERAIYSRALNASERQAVENGMWDRAGFTIDREDPLYLSGIQAFWDAKNITTIQASLDPDLTTYTNGGSGTVSLSSFTDNGVTAYRMTESTDGVNSTHYLVKAIVNGAGTTNILEFDVCNQAGSSGWMAFAPNNGGFAVSVNIAAGTLGTTTGSPPAGTTTTITNTGETSGDGYTYYRIKCVYTYISANTRFYTANADTNTNYPGSGRNICRIKNISLTQYRVNRINDYCASKYFLLQSTAANQPLYTSGVAGSFLDGYIVATNRPAMTETINDGSTTKLLSLTGSSSLPGIFTGSDKPITCIFLFKKNGNPSLANYALQLSSGGAAAHQFGRISTTGNLECRRVDDTGTSVNTSYGSLSDGTHIVTQVFNGTQEIAYVDGVQFGSAQALDVGTTNFSAISLSVRRSSLYSVCIANRMLKAAEITDIENGMKRRAGLI